MKRDEGRQIDIALGFLALAALLLAAVPALLVWGWHLMSPSDPGTILALIASWVCALAILAGCVWIRHRLCSTTPSSSKAVNETAEAPIPSP